MKKDNIEIDTEIFIALTRYALTKWENDERGVTCDVSEIADATKK